MAECVALFGPDPLPLAWAPLCGFPALPSSAAAASTSTMLTGAGVLVALIAVLVALFKDEFWHWRHAPKLLVTLERGGITLETLYLRVRNTSKRQGAEDAFVRVTDVSPHPLGAAIGPREVGGAVTADKLLKRSSQEEKFDVAPQGEVRLELLTLRDGQTASDPVIARVAWGGPTANIDLDDLGKDALIVLPSADQRESWGGNYPDLAASMDAPAIIRLEVGASNVPARIWSVSLSRTPDLPPAQQLPMAATRYGGVPQAELTEGAADFPSMPHAGKLSMRESQDQ